MFYQQVLGMDLVREVTFGDISKVWLQLPADQSGDLFGNASSMIELVQRHGTENDDDFQINSQSKGFHHICISVPDIRQAKRRFENLGVKILDIGSPKNEIMVIEDPDGYPVQLLAQDVGKYDELEKSVREAVMAGNMAAMDRIRQSNDVTTIEEAGLAHIVEPHRRS